MERFRYRDRQLDTISFPLGGIGTGSIGLAGNGRLIDWEIFNRPSKGTVNGFSHFSVRAERYGKLLDARILQGDMTSPYMGEIHAPRWNSFGWGPRREYLTGMPHFRDVTFQGEFPFAELTFADSSFPGEPRLRAFNPFIPLNDKDSGLPAAFFEISIHNTSDQAIDYTVAGVLGNPLPANNINRRLTSNGLSGVHLTCDSLSSDDTRYGDLTLATDAEQTSIQEYWYRGEWFDSLEMYWRDFTAPGPLKERVYSPSQSGERNQALVAAHFELAPGATKSVRFIIAWNFPICHNYWTPGMDERAVQAHIAPTWKNYYATLWPDSCSTAQYAFAEWDRLHMETDTFKKALFASTLPIAALDAVAANISILKTATVLRLEDGTFYGWEGMHPDEGSCEGSCTHVWNYAQALPFLFPKLERSMRMADYRYNLRSDGGMPFRLQLPLGVGYWDFRPCADGQFGGVLKTYRDWKISGDTEWLRTLWPMVKQSLEFAWSVDNIDRWDPDKTGVLWGRQHHTLDMELLGPNSWLTGFYLGALKAASEMAAYLGEDASATEYREIFARGKAWVDQYLFNGEYYQQIIDLTNIEQLRVFDDGSLSLKGGTTSEAYWNTEAQEVKYQIGDGCMIDQVLAQWHANLYGLGELFNPQQTRTALQALYNHNFRRVRDAYNPCRIYSLNDERGLIICTWPDEHHKPVIPVPYAQETMHGFEYAAAMQMLQYGLIDEGTHVVEAIRERYDGEKRNPWNEMECGSNYARSMASYALLNTYSGFSFDMVRGEIGFKPILGGPFRCFWSLDSAWGEFETDGTHSSLRILYGELRIKRLNLPAELIQSSIRAGGFIAFTVNSDAILFNEWITLQAGTSLYIGQDGAR